MEKNKGLTVGHAALGFRSGVAGSVKEQVHDGDTINVTTVGNFGIRFLSVDAPEISAQLPGETSFTGLANQKWETFLSDPFSDELTPFAPPLDPELLEYLQNKVGPVTALNHYFHATTSEDSLEESVQTDLQILGKTEETFQFFLVFAYEIMDRYGRLLCFIDRNQPDAEDPEPRPKSYNERLLEKGQVSPYFIWPNINPFRIASSIIDAVIEPNTTSDIANTDNALNQARQWVKKNREEQIGVFQQNNPLKLEPFELRFFSRRTPPNRWVIDLSKNDDQLIRPQNYHTINIEDRLYIPEEYIPLFTKQGWIKETD